MKNTIKTLTSLTLAFTLLLTGTLIPSNANDGIMLLHNGPSHDVMSH